MEIDVKTLETALSHMRHELRTPINAILGYSEMLIEEAEDGGQAQFVSDLKRINEAGKRILAMVGELLQPVKFGVPGDGPDAPGPADAPPPQEDAQSPPDLKPVMLPEDLKAALREAVDMHNVTRVKTCLAEMAGMGGGAAQLATHMTELVSRYDMNGLRAVLKETGNG